MPTRKTLLRWMLVALAFTALTGVLAVLVEASHVAWQIVGTGFATAVACALLMPITGMIDRAKSRSAGLVGMFWVVGEYLLTLLLIWEIPHNFFAHSYEEELALTAVVLLPAGPIAMALLKLTNQPYGRLAGRIGVVVVVAALLACWTGIWWRAAIAFIPSPVSDPSGFHTAEAWWKTGGSISIYGGLSVLCLIGLAAPDPRKWRWLGIVAAVFAGAIWLLDAWLRVGSDPGFVAFATLTSIASVVAFTNLCLYCPLKEGQGWVRVGAILSAMVTATALDASFVDIKLLHAGYADAFLFRIASAGGILCGCSALALVVLARINRGVDYEPLAAEILTVDLVCPRCRKKQAVRLGDSVCAGCALRISIRIEEPRCPKCGYLLFQLTSPRCPECGAPLPERASTAGPATQPST